MATAERLQPASMGLFERVKKMFVDLFHRKLIEKEAKKAQEKMYESEKRQAREEEDRRKREEDEAREYRERRSGQEQVETLEAARQAQIEEIKRNFDQFIQDHGRTGSGYLYNELVRDTDMQDRIKRLIEQSPGAANLIDALTTKGVELHGNPTELIKLCRLLAFEAKKVNMLADISVLTDAMSQQATELVKDTIEVYKKEARARGRREIDAPIWLIDEFKTVLSEEDQRKLENGDVTIWSPVIKNLMTNPPEAVDAPWTNVDNGPLGTIPNAPPKELVQEVDKIWQEVKESEESGQQLSVDKIQEIERKIYAAESATFPKDVIPGTEAYHKTVLASDGFIQERLNRLATQLSERLKTDRPPVRQGITKTKEFLDEMVKNPGRLGQLLELNPEMEKLFVGNVAKDDLEKSRRFRDQVFLTIHSQILTDRRSSSHENFGLYERADFTTFVNLLRSSLSDKIRPATGMTYGQTWVEWYVSLSNTIRHSRDIDFWASQPGAKIEDFQKSLSLFQNEYSVQALSIPAVEQAYRAYEDSLQSIKDTNDGYIPPALVGYDPIHGVSYWDQRAQEMLEKMIRMGVVHDAEREELSGFHKVEDDGNTIKLGNKLDLNKLKKEDPQDLQLNLYMTLAKGFGMASLRYLEIFANAKVPGSDQPELGMVNFHSTPYEGVAMSLNYWSVMVHKWKFSSYKYLQVMNTLLPEEHKIRHIDAHEGIKAYLAYRDGTFKEKYGKEAKRLIDLLNFSGASSAFGPPYTQWRYMDTTIGWSDKQRELLGGPAQIMYSKRFAGAKVKDYLVVGKYREKFRQMMRETGKPVSGTEFDRLWQERGAGMYKNQIESEWEMLQKKHGQEIEHLTKQYQRAFTSRVWVEMAMRNPLVVAHNTEIEVPDIVPGKTRKIKLHSYLAQKILGIPLEDTKYGEVAGKAAPYSSPTETQRRLMAEVMDLEGDLVAVRERAIQENRELREDDFDMLKDKKKEHALKYWQLVRKTMFGDLDYEHLYDQFGLKLSENGEDYEVDWGKIKRIDGKDGILERIGKETTGLAERGGRIRLDEEWVGKDWDRTFGSDDVAYRKMNILNLGPRQWVRRGGDAVAHYQGGVRGGSYLIDDLKPNPNPEDLAKALFEVRKAYEGDMIETGWQVAGLLAHATARLYAYDYRRLGSAAQLDVWKTRRGVAAWNANGRRRFFDTLEHLDVLPPVTPSGPGAYATQGPYKIPHDIHELRKLNRAGNADVWTEIILLGVALAVALTIYRALTAPSEEEEGGGGGGGGGHH